MKALDVLDRVEATVRKFRMFSQGDRVGVAVSGGRDSVCLLDLLCRLAPKWRLQLVVLHVNHRLRPESDEEEAFVRALAARYGLDCIVDRPALGAGNLEEAAREARLQFFRRSGCARVATGHTLDDQAETVLFRILRGAGLAGLAAIRPVADVVARPLLEIRRAEVGEWVSAHRLEFREDSSNTEARFARNRIRGELLPQLERDWNPRLSEILARMASVAAAEDRYLEACLPVVEPEADGSVVLDWRALEALDPALRPRLVRQAIRRIKGDLARIDLAHVERVLTLRPGHDRVILPAVDVIRSFGWLRFSAYPRPEEAPRGWAIEAQPGFAQEIPGGHRISIQLRAGSDDYNEGACSVADRGGPLLLRGWRPGDRICLPGRAGPASLKELFQEFRIPLWERRNWPVIESSGVIVWSGEFGAAALPGEAKLLVEFQPRPVRYRPLVNQMGSFPRLKDLGPGVLGSRHEF
jgi:tRNA(Ile)-lysidine synthase